MIRLGDVSPRRRLWPSLASRITNGLALAALYALALSVDLSTAGFNLAVFILLLASIPRLPSIWEDVKGLPAFWLVVALTAYVVIQSLLLASSHAIMHESSNPHWSHVARVAGLPSLVIGWWLLQYRRHVPWLIVLVVVSLLVNRLLAIDYPAVVETPFASRSVWGDAAVRVGFASATGAVICLAALLYLTIDAGYLRSWLGRGAIAAAGVGFVGFLIALYGSQTRGAWLGALVAFGFLAITAAFRALRASRGWSAVIVVTLVLVAVLGLTVGLDQGEVLERRVTGESAAVEAIANLDREALYAANRSMGLRVNMWTEAMTALKDRPWFGYGVGTKPLLEQRSDLDIGGTTGHLHNVYVELGYGLGILGLVGFLAVYSVLFRGFVRACRSGLVPKGITMVVGSFWVMTPVTLLTDVRIGHANSRAVLIFMLALVCWGVLMHHIRTRTQRPAEDGEPCASQP